MARFGDIGPYVRGNVRIITVEENYAERKLLLGRDNPFWGRQHTDATKIKISRAKQGSHMSAEAREKIGAASRGKVLSASTKAKIGAAHRGKKVSVVTRARLSEAWVRRRARALRGLS